MPRQSLCQWTDADFMQSHPSQSGGLFQGTRVKIQQGVHLQSLLYSSAVQGWKYSLVERGGSTNIHKHGGGQVPVKAAHLGCAHLRSGSRGTSVEAHMPPEQKAPRQEAHRHFQMAVFHCLKCGKNGMVFTSKKALGIHSFSTFSYFLIIIYKNQFPELFDSEWNLWVQPILSRVITETQRP